MQNREMVERVARAIANANGDVFANAFKNKSRWIAKRGMSGGRYRDVNEPFQSDYLDMARAAIAAMADWRPIEEAPKDGTVIDLWVINHLTWDKRGERVVNKKWGPCIDWLRIEREGWGLGEHLEPTHWMKVSPPSISPLADLVGGSDE